MDARFRVRFLALLATAALLSAATLLVPSTSTHGSTAVARADGDLNATVG